MKQSKICDVLALYSVRRKWIAAEWENSMRSRWRLYKQLESLFRKFEMHRRQATAATSRELPYKLFA